MNENEFNIIGGARLLKVRQAQTILNLGNTKFYQLVKLGQIEIVKIGRSSFVKATSLSQFIDSLAPINRKQSDG
jgi:hypothetical protein